MDNTFDYLMNIIKEIEETTNFRYAEEKWAVDLRIAGGIKKYIKNLNKEIMDYLYGDLKRKRVDLSDKQIQQIEGARKEAMRKAEARFGSFD